MDVESFNFISCLDSFGGGEYFHCGDGVAYRYGFGCAGNGSGCSDEWGRFFGNGYGDGDGDGKGTGYGDGDGDCYGNRHGDSY